MLTVQLKGNSPVWILKQQCYSNKLFKNEKKIFEYDESNLVCCFKPQADVQNVPQILHSNPVETRW